MTIDEIREVFKGLVITKRYQAATRQIGSFLKEKGYEITYGFPIVQSTDYRKDHNAIDITATKDNEVIAIELDNKVPGSKALTKFYNVDDSYVKVILLRNPDYGYKVIGRNTIAIGLKIYKD